jgi:hypothetical protein
MTISTESTTYLATVRAAILVLTMGEMEQLNLFFGGGGISVRGKSRCGSFQRESSILLVCSLAFVVDTDQYVEKLAS